MDSSQKISVFVFHYKEGEPFPNFPCYKHIWAGKNDSSIENELIGDDTGDHISYKNNYYSELTGIYWAWKNTTSHIVATTHYRRFFTLYPIPFSEKLKRFGYAFIGLNRKRFGLIYTSNKAFWENKLLKCNDIENLMEQYDAVLPLPRKLKYSVETHFQRYHHFDDLQLLKTIVTELFPGYTSTMENMLKQNRLYANNMFILKRNDFDQLCEWLFTLLFEFEKRVSLEHYIGYQERIFGFLAERLITLWFLHRNLKVKELPLVYFKHLKFN
jgi:hypothetical protein